MSFVQVDEDEARRFATSLEKSGAWRAVTPKGEWEAFRLIKIKWTTPEQPWHSPLGKVIIIKNKKGVHSFDPQHLPAFDGCRKAEGLDEV